MTDECVALLNTIEGEPIHVDFCEDVMGAVVNEPGGAEYVPMKSIRCPMPTGFVARRLAYVSMFTTSV